MGLFDSLKSAVNFVTGGAAKVSLTLGPRGADGSYPATIGAVAPDTDFKIARAYLKVEGTETVTVRIKKEGQTLESDHTESSALFSQEIDVAPAQTLAKGQPYTWEAKITLPADAKPTYLGKRARHEWRAYAALSASGNDPASSWVTFIV